MTCFERQVTLADLRVLIDRYRNWGTWSDEDELGSMNYVTAERVRDAAGLVRKGRVFSLAIPLDHTGPMNGNLGRTNPIHVMLRDGGDIAKNLDAHVWADFDYTDDAVYMVLQCATQWDAFSHVFWEGRTYNGFDHSHVDSYGAHHCAITNVKDRMAGRGVLLDIPKLTGRRWLEPGEAIEIEDLEAACQEHKVTVGEGDFVAVRTGAIGQAREEGAWGPQFHGGAAPGLGVSTAEFFCERRVAAVATDTMALEVMPSQTQDDCNLLVPLHVVMTIGAGIHLGEMWDLEELATDCADDGIYEYMVVAPPLTISRAVGSPINPQAIK
jgi:kynurenine formamidase